MPYVERIAAGTSSRIEIEGFLLFISVQDFFELPMREENSAFDEVMRFVTCELLEALDELSSDFLRSELN